MFRKNLSLVFIMVLIIGTTFLSFNCSESLAKTTGDETTTTTISLDYARYGEYDDERFVFYLRINFDNYIYIYINFDLDKFDFDNYFYFADHNNDNNFFGSLWVSI